jgi:hypothetical protein
MTNRRQALQLALAGSVAALPTLSHPSAAKGISIPVVGRFISARGERGVFAGHVLVNRFEAAGGKLLSSGVLRGTLSDAAGNIVNTVNDVAVNAVPTQVPPGTCEIAVLTIGPLKIDLLGLVIEIPMECEVQIYADPEGGLLGRLLCGLLNPQAEARAAALNRIAGLFS